MKIGPGYDNRGAIRRWAHVNEASACRMMKATSRTLAVWESTHTDYMTGRFSSGRRGELERAELIVKFVDVYAALMWIAGGCRWPDVLDDEPLRAAMERMRREASQVLKAYPSASEAFPVQSVSRE